jgi:hypothetical protein
MIARINEAEMQGKRNASLTSAFFNRDALIVARELLGCALVLRRGGSLQRSMITETEAYIGPQDLASHAARGRTEREAELLQGLERIVVAAVGPIVAAELNAIGVQVNVTPRDNTFFMKPLVRELAAALKEKQGLTVERSQSGCGSCNLRESDDRSGNR